MKILAVEFSSEQRSVAAVEQSAIDVHLRGTALEVGGRNAHATALIEQALSQAGWGREAIECLAVGIGPGSYTGIRAALALAQGWQLVRPVKVVGVSSVRCLAERVWVNGERQKVNIIVDAQRNEFYLAGYELNATGVQEVEPLRIVTLDEIRRRIVAGERMFGPDVNRVFPEAQDLFPDSHMLAKLAVREEGVASAEQLEPIYLREVSFVKAPPPRVIADPSARREPLD